MPGTPGGGGSGALVLVEQEHAQDNLGSDRFNMELNITIINSIADRLWLFFLTGSGSNKKVDFQLFNKFLTKPHPHH